MPTINSIYIWNILSTGIFAVSSFIMLIATTHLLGAYWGGVFSISLAMAQQMFTLGFFSIRRYQASDINETYSFTTYLTARSITCFLMIFFGIIWAVRMSPEGIFSSDKSIVFFWILLYKTSEAFSDVLGGRYQQKDKYDISCKILFSKTLASTIIFLVTLFTTKNLVLSLSFMTFCHIALTILLDTRAIKKFDMGDKKISLKPCFYLLFTCFPLALEAFFRMYINNSPKYAINAILDEESIAAFSALFMISFILAMFSEFFLNPQITPLANAMNNREYGVVNKIISQQTLALCAITIIGIPLAWFVGTEVLSFVFNLELTHLRQELCLLLCGGFILALFLLSQLILIVLRKQIMCLPGILLASAFAYLYSLKLVEKLSIKGACFSYLISMSILFITTALITTILYNKKKRTSI